jgi:hypothetical protein
MLTQSTPQGKLEVQKIQNRNESQNPNADVERELDRMESDLYGAIVLADGHVRDLLRGIRKRVVLALAAVQAQRLEDRE